VSVGISRCNWERDERLVLKEGGRGIRDTKKGMECILDIARGKLSIFVLLESQGACGGFHL
jgi:hypothetical protein